MIKFLIWVGFIASLYGDGFPNLNFGAEDLFFTYFFAGTFEATPSAGDGGRFHFIKNLFQLLMESEVL